MRISNLIFFALMGLVSCRPNDSMDANDAGSIVFATTPVQSPSLLVKARLKCFPGKQHLELKLTLESLVPEKISIHEIVLDNPRSLKSLDERMAGKIIGVSGDTTLFVSFNPINDKLLFQATGLPGLIDSVYNLSVFYSIEGKDDIRVVNLVSRMPEEAFLSYRKSFDVPVQIYYCNTGNGFDERQREFLKTSGITKTNPFVHITEQEVAVSGLNFRIKCFHRKDSLYAEVFAVNHSDLTIRMDTSKMELILDDSQSESSDTELNSEKVTGSTSDAAILRKGDRAIIKMRKYVRGNPQRLWFAFSEAFFLGNGKALFYDELELIQAGR